MTPSKLWAVLMAYDAVLRERLYSPTQMTEEEYHSRQLRTHTLLNHCRWMCQRCLQVFKPEFDTAWAALTGRFSLELSVELISQIEKAREPLEKAMRWLGYIQGVLNVTGVYSCQDLRQHSREEKAALPTPPHDSVH